MLIFLIFVCFPTLAISITDQHSDSDCYECVAEECYDPYNKTCSNAFACFTNAAISPRGRLILEKGCFYKFFPGYFICYEAILRKAKNDTNRLMNCCQGDLCNNDPFQEPSLPTTLMPNGENEERDSKENGSTSICLIVLGVILSIFGAVFCGCMYYFRKTRWIAYRFRRLASFCGCSCCKPSYKFGIELSGSGPGIHNLVQRNLAQDVFPVRYIGRGRFGEVWEGTKRGEKVAIKVFHSRDELSWRREVKIYTSIALYHENVLGFKGALITSVQASTEMWLLTPFHEKGSLYDYLNMNCITHEQMITFVRSACSGLAHLHTEVICEIGKPAIAHRDLKSKNILVNNHGECVIADFGLAVVYNSETGTADIPANYLVGTKRYMAPELLDDSMRIGRFESFKKADIYSFGLVLWEACTRCLIKGTAEDYHAPYYDCAPRDPGFEVMKQIVCVENRRPEIPERWSLDEPLSAMAQLMKQCWHGNPDARYTISRVQKILDKIHAQIHAPKSATEAECLV